MPSLTKKQLDYIVSLGNYNNINCFVETGTYLGDTIFEMEKYFDKLHTIELSPYYYKKCANKSKKIKFHLGDSGLMLDTVLKQINEPTIFFLDGHWSSGMTGKGKKDCPLVEELSFINKYHNHNSIIIIDDKGIFGTHMNENWTDITKENLLKELKGKVVSTHDVGDRYVIFIKKI